MNVILKSLNDIRIDGGTQSRKLIDQNLVYQYLECMKDGDEFPLMEAIYDGSTFWLTDGFHRYHAYKLQGTKEVLLKYSGGTQQDAQVVSFGANGRHGKPRTNEDKHNAVMQALEHPLTKDKTTYEIAKICVVSQPFVAAIRNPEQKVKQAEAKERSAKKVLKEITGKQESYETISDTKVSDGSTPDADELKATELAIQADMEMMYKLLESDEPLAEAHDEIKRLNHQNAQLEIRLHGLMMERNEAVKMIKQLQKENDKLKAKK